MKTDYDNIIPAGVLFNLKQIEEMHILKVSMAKKLVQNREIETVKIGNKLHISRAILIQYLEENTIEAA